MLTKKIKYFSSDSSIATYCFVVFPFLQLTAQVNVSGKVKTADNQPVPFANVLVLQPVDSTLVLGNITNDEGLFSLNIKPGEYILNISMIGYNPVYKPIEINSSKEQILTEDFSLSENVTELKEIVVNGVRPLYEKQADRTIINVQNSITSAGNTVLEVLEKSPGVSVNRQAQNIVLNGKTGVSVMINNKITRLPIDAVVQMLDGMSAANIGKIELITNPPSKYDAEGEAGIIHIVMKENTESGTNGNYGLKLGYNHDEILGANLNLSHRSKRFNLFINYDINYDRNIHKSMIQRYRTVDGFTQSETDTSIRHPKITVQNLQVGAEYNFADKTSVSFLITGYQRKFDNVAKTTNINTLTPDSVFVTEMDIQNMDNWRSTGGSLGARHRLNERNEVSISLDYLFYHNHNPSNYNNITWINDSQIPESEIVSIDKITPIHFKIANFDYTASINDKLLMEAGLKGADSDFTNDVKTTRTKGNEIFIDSLFTSYSSLDEMILAAYLSLNWQLTENWNLQGGLRYEFTDTYLGTPEEPGIVDTVYGKFFPNFLISHKLNQSNKLNLLYNRRITRPTYQNLAPFVFFFGYNTFVSGNIELKPAISDNFELNYQWKQLSVSLKYSYSKNAIATWQGEFNEELNLQIYRAQNMKYMQTYGTSIIFPVQITSWWKLQNDISFYINEIETQHLKNNVHDQLGSLSASLANTFKLPENFSAEILAFYQSPTIAGSSTVGATGSLNIGIQKKFKNDAMLILSVTDLLNTDKWIRETDDKESNSWSRWEYDWGRRAINLTFRQSFGNKKLKEVKIKSGSEDERKRVQ